ncbi:MAG: acyl-CoA dehydrogenase family protein [Myxococcales bacterium]|nr:acyl-CoA dehydrogenase family protein [Myxococcales bacterium]
MDFALDETQQMIRDSVRSFVSGQVREPAMKWNEGHGDANAALKELGGLGLLGILAPENAGGAGLDVATLILSLIELATGDAGLAAMVAHHNGPALGHLLDADFSDKKLLSRFASGDALLCRATDEGQAHLDSATVETTATQQPDGGWQVSGSKRLVPLGTLASHAIVSAKTLGGADIHLLVDLSAPGVSRQASASLVGLSTCDLADLTLSEVQVPAAMTVGSSSRAVALGRLTTAAIALGVTRAALAAGVTYTLERKQFGKPIARFQPMQWQTADSATELEAAELLTYRAAWQLSTGDARDFAVEKAAVFAMEAAQRVADRALQMHGGYGYTEDFPVERHFRDAATLRLLTDGPDLQRVVIAKGLAQAV